MGLFEVLLPWSGELVSAKRIVLKVLLTGLQVSVSVVVGHGGSSG